MLLAIEHAILFFFSARGKVIYCIRIGLHMYFDTLHVLLFPQVIADADNMEVVSFDDFQELNCHIISSAGAFIFGVIFQVL